MWWLVVVIVVSFRMGWSWILVVMPVVILHVLSFANCRREARRGCTDFW